VPELWTLGIVRTYEISTITQIEKLDSNYVGALIIAFGFYG
jgi:hypothetical protein